MVTIKRLDLMVNIRRIVERFDKRFRLLFLAAPTAIVPPLTFQNGPQHSLRLYKDTEERWIRPWTTNIVLISVLSWFTDSYTIVICSQACICEENWNEGEIPKSESKARWMPDRL